MKLHELKTDPIVFMDVANGYKNFEIRYDDRGFQVRDVLLLRETKYDGARMKQDAVKYPLIYTGREITALVTYRLAGYGLMEGWCILGIKVVDKGDS